MRTPLHVVGPADTARPTPETPAERVRALQAEARRLAADNVHCYVAAIIAAQLAAQDIAGGGEAYPAGIRDRARRFADACETEVQTLQALAARSAP